MSEFHRGQLNEDVQKLSQAFFGRDITLTELRLFPYIDYCLKNGGKFDPRKINAQEVDICCEYTKKYPQHFNFTLCEIEISKEFYQFIQDVLWIAYVPNKLPREEGI